ncbi:MAG: DUF4012 domain-containing protein [Candidatus Kerfeldbacteria bacterium]|nr:DUF4012 domain-containing protein [Candidatus Kerfeldbacteria bacterium]
MLGGPPGKVNIKPRQHRPIIEDVPAGNVLDLRSAIRPPAEPVGRNRVLKEFWTEPAAPRRPVRTPAPKKDRQPRRPWREIIAANFGASRMLLRATFTRWRIGSFPFVAAGLLVLVAGIAGLGSLLGVQSRVAAIARSGVDSLRTAGAQATSHDLAGASTSLSAAADDFSKAEAEFASINPLIGSVIARLPIAGSRLNSGRHLIAAAKLISEAGARFATLAQPLTESSEGFAGPASLVERLKNDRATLDAIVADTRVALDELSQVNPNDVPDPYHDAVASLRLALPGLRSSISGLSDATSVLADLLGTDEPREHLFVFQNSNELRPTGGFIGSFALIRMDHGQFHILDAPDKGSFGVDEYLPDTITPPLPLQVITPGWYFRDANWYPDWPTSARQLLNMYNQARGFSPRGVIGITSGFLERMLEVTGPIELTNYGLTVDAGNVTTTVQDQVERKYDLRTNDPKRFVVDLIPVMATRLSNLSLASYPRFLAAVAESVTAGDLQLWSADTGLQETVVRLGWSGRMAPITGDSLDVIDTNVGGGKTDGVIKESIVQTLTVAPDGAIRTRVDITRTHTGTIGDVFTGSRNRTYHRLYVPAGSRFISATGFEPIPAANYRPLPAGSTADQLLRSIEGRVTVDEASGTRMNNEFGRTVFGNWTEIDPGQTKTVSIVYEPPTKLTGELARYDLTVGRQAGARNRTYELHVLTPDNRQIAWTSDANIRTGATGLNYQAELDQVLRLSFVAESK